MAGVITRATRAQAAATNTTQNFTVSGFGTPVAAYLYWTDGTTADTDVAGMGQGHGFYDGTRSYSSSMRAVDNVVATSTTRSGTMIRNDAVVTVYDRHNTNATRTATCAFTTDGVTLTWAGDTTYVPYVTVVLFKGCTAYAGTVTASASVDGTASATASGTPDFVMMVNVDSTSFNSNIQSARCAVGVAWDDGGGAPYPQYGVYLRDLATGGATTSQTCYMAADRVAVSSSSTAVSYEVTAWSSNAFEVTTRTAATASALIYLALDTGGTAEAFQLTTITGTGDWAPTLATAAPTSVIMWPTALTSVGTASSAGDTCAGSGFWYANSSTTAEQYGHYTRGDDGSDPSDMTSRITSKFIVMGETDGTVLYTADASSITWTSTGFSIPGADVTENASARYYIGVAFTGTSASASAGRLLLLGVG